MLCLLQQVGLGTVRCPCFANQHLIFHVALHFLWYFRNVISGDISSRFSGMVQFLQNFVQLPNLPSLSKCMLESSAQICKKGLHCELTRSGSRFRRRFAHYSHQCELCTAGLVCLVFTDLCFNQLPCLFYSFYHKIS